MMLLRVMCGSSRGECTVFPRIRVEWADDVLGVFRIRSRLWMGVLSFCLSLTMGLSRKIIRFWRPRCLRIIRYDSNIPHNTREELTTPERSPCQRPRHSPQIPRQHPPRRTLHLPRHPSPLRHRRPKRLNPRRPRPTLSVLLIPLLPTTSPPRRRRLRQDNRPSHLPHRRELLRRHSDRAPRRHARDPLASQQRRVDVFYQGTGPRDAVFSAVDGDDV